MPVTTQQIQAAISALTDRIGLSLGYGTGEDPYTKKRILYINGLPFSQYYAQTRSEFLGYIRGLGDGYEHAISSKVQALETKLNQATDKISDREKKLQQFCNLSKKMIDATDEDIFTDAPECEEAVDDVAECSSNLWKFVQSMPTYIRETEEKAHEKELEAIQIAADFLDRTIGGDEYQISTHAEVEFVEGGAWVPVRVYVSPDSAFEGET